MKKSSPLPKTLLFIYVLFFAWSAIGNFGWQNWIAEILPIVVFIGMLVILYAKKIFRFSNFAYVLMIIWPILHTIGAKYSFALVPLDFLSDITSDGRNHFDRIAHFSIGFLAVGVAEMSWKLKKVSSKAMAYFLGILFILSLAGVYEILEWKYAVMFGGEDAASFLGSQGDIWDAQKDMLMDGLGALFGIGLYHVFYRKK